jgi:eukaryotic-like serine/threonine-protein kinase
VTENTSAVRSDFVSGQLVAGEILTAKLRREMVSPEEALCYAIDLGVALSRAHARGLVHGKVSPQTILIGRLGAVLLKPLYSEHIEPGYRAPEQVLGNPADERSDIFAFGALLYELVSGEASFQGEGSDLNAAILKRDPPALKSSLPIHQAMEPVIVGCLEKDPAKRRQRIQNAVSELKLAARALGKLTPEGRAFPARSMPLEDPVPRNSRGVDLDGSPDLPSAKRAGPYVRPISARKPYQTPKRGIGLRVWIGIAAVLLLCAGSVAAVMLLPGRNSTPVYRFSLDQEGTKYPGMPAISPDGRSLSWLATAPDGKRMLWLQPLNSAHAKPIPYSEGAAAPFWSPDSSHLGFFAGGFLKTVRVQDGASSGAPLNICPVDTFSGGGAWNRDGTIVFAPSLSSGLSRVAAGGGTPQPLTTLNAVKNERSHLWPQFLPDGNHFIFFVGADSGQATGVYGGSLDSPNYNLLFRSTTNAVYSGGGPAAGYVLFIRDGSLLGQPFNASKLAPAGDVVTLATSVDAVESLSLAQVSVSANGTLVYQSAGKSTRQLSWLDRTGKSVGTVGEPADWGPPRISPDGKRIAAGKRDEKSGIAVLWVLNAADGSAFQLTHMARGASSQPVWSPDGSQIAFASDELGTYDLYVQPANAQSQPELLYRDAHKKAFDDWSRDGRTLLFDEIIPGMARGLWMWNSGQRKISTIVDTIHSEGYGALSPDGKWVAYQSDETGINQVIVRARDDGSREKRKLFTISRGGGGLPRWRRDGRELYYITQPGRLFAVTVHPSGSEFGFDPPQELFHTRPTPKSWNLYDVSSDGERFLMNTPIDWPSGAKIAVITSWMKELQ